MSIRSNRVFGGWALLVVLWCTPALAQPAVFIEAPTVRTVVSESGLAYSIPFFGGFNNPVPQLVDIDDDGDLDLFVQEIRGQVQFYRNVGSSTDYDFRLVDRHYPQVEVAEWFRFADADADNDYDLFAGQTFNAIRYYENTGSAAFASFVLRTDSLRASDGTPVTTEPPNVPVIVDIDCDGQLDLLLGKVSGSVSHFRQTGVASSSPVFEFVQDDFQGISVIGEAGKDEAQGKHGANALAAGDLDGDGLLDLVWGDFFEPSLITFQNTGASCSTVNLVRTSDTLFTSNGGAFLTRGYNLPEIGDLTGDGLNDIISGVASNAAVDDERNLFLFENEGSGSFGLSTDRLIDGIDVGSASVPAFGDINGDGLRDMLVANSIGDSGVGGQLAYYQHDGVGFTFVTADLLDESLGFSYNPDVGDLDADGDEDLVIGLFDGTVVHLTNNGPLADPQFTVVSLDLLGEDVGSNAAPALIDIDADGDLDLFVGESSGVLNYFQNMGTPQQPSFVLTAGLVDAIDVGQNSVPTAGNFLSPWGEPFDLVIGSESEGLFLLINRGTFTEPAFPIIEPIELNVPPKSAPRFELIDSFDALPDLVVGNVSGGLLFFAHTVFGATSDQPLLPTNVVKNIFPNPATDEVHVTYQLERVGQIHISIIDMLGRVRIERSEIQQGAGSVTEMISVRALPAGIYLIQVHNQQSLIGSGTVVIL